MLWLLLIIFPRVPKGTGRPKITNTITVFTLSSLKNIYNKNEAMFVPYFYKIYQFFLGKQFPQTYKMAMLCDTSMVNDGYMPLLGSIPIFHIQFPFNLFPAIG